jgi:para-aminobenzoate synthetase/4-amino-4-deoxychorismate lyase
MTPPKFQAILFDDKRKTWCHFADPHQVFCVYDINEVKSTLEKVESLAAAFGYYAVGFVSYDATATFLPQTAPHIAPNFPLLWFGLYGPPIESQHLSEPAGDVKLGQWVPDISKKEYERSFHEIKRQIETGYTYQVNLTFRLKSSIDGDPYALFVNMVRAQQKCYGAFIDTGDLIISSASPELFFTRYGETIKSMPMKGTSPRGRSTQEDLQNSKALQSSIKNRAENIMIVDMIRNDIGRIAKTGSVRVNPLFHIEKYPTLLQMTSTVWGKTNKSVTELFSALFPCASITGAPKISTIKIITDCEKSPRKIYTGAIGFIDPKRNCQFNVAIRTAIINKSEKTVEYGIGGGIVWDSTLRSEYDEAILKANVITQKRPIFSIKEAILWDPTTGFFLLKEHLHRMKRTADYFGFPLNSRDFELQLYAATTSLHQSHKIKVELNQTGQLLIVPEPIANTGTTQFVNLKLSSSQVNSNNPFLYHKTTQWAQIFPEHSANPEEDFLYTNEKGEVTESAIANLVVFDGRHYFTPPIECGLLGGTFRNYLVSNGLLREKLILLEDLPSYKKLYLINSVRGWRPAKIIG